MRQIRQPKVSPIPYQKGLNLGRPKLGAALMERYPWPETEGTIFTSPGISLESEDMKQVAINFQLIESQNKMLKTSQRLLLR